LVANNSNPLKSIWNWFSTISGIVGLASLLDNLLVWKGFIGKFIGFYQSLIYPIFNFLFTWVPFSIPNYVYDYLVLGIIVAGSYIRTLTSIDEIQGYGSNIIPLDLEFTGVIIRVVGWPFVLGAYSIRLIIKRFDEKKEEERWLSHYKNNPPKGGDLENRVKSMVRYSYGVYMEPIKFFQWFGAISVGCILLVILNQVI